MFSFISCEIIERLTVPAGLQKDVQFSTFLAQLAANFAVGGGPEKDVTKWYNKYSEVLMTLGWILHDFKYATVPLYH